MYVYLQKSRASELPKSISKHIHNGDPNNIQQSPARKGERGEEEIGRKKVNLVSKGHRKLEDRKHSVTGRIVDGGKGIVIGVEFGRIHMQEGCKHGVLVGG